MMCLRAQRKIGRERNFSKRAEEELEREKDLRRIAEAEAQGLREALHGQPGASGSRAPERSDAAHSVSNASMSWRSSPGPSAALPHCHVRRSAASTCLTSRIDCRSLAAPLTQPTLALAFLQRRIVGWL